MGLYQQNLIQKAQKTTNITERVVTDNMNKHNFPHKQNCSTKISV